MSLKRFVRRLGGVVKKIAPVAASFIPGVGGMVAQAIASSQSEREAAKMQLRAAVPLEPGGFGGAVQPIMGMSPRLMEGGGGFTTVGGFGGGLTTMPLSPTQTLPMPAGTGVAQAGVVRMQGRDGRFRSYRWNARKGRYVQVRRMSACNTSALRRALRRVEGFVKLEKRVDKIVNRAARSSRGARAHGFVRSKAKR